MTTPRKNARAQLGPNLSALYAEAKPGCCIACDFPILRKRNVHPGPKQVLCGLVECRRIYQRAADRDRPRSKNLRRAAR